MADARKTMQNFFLFFGIGILISAIKNDVSRLPLIEIVKGQLLNIQNDIRSGIFFGLSSMATVDLYLFIRRKLKEDEQSTN